MPSTIYTSPSHFGFLPVLGFTTSLGLKVELAVCTQGAFILVRDTNVINVPRTSDRRDARANDTHMHTFLY
jgi:hypothetical protein